MEFHERLKELRKNKNLTQQELADLINVNRVTYRNYETGLSEPKFRTLLDLSKIFNVTSDYLLGITDENDLEANHNKQIEQISRTIGKLSKLYEAELDEQVYKLLSMVEYNKASTNEVGETLKRLIYINKKKYMIDIEPFIKQMINKWSSFDIDKQKLISIINQQSDPSGNTLETTDTK